MHQLPVLLRTIVDGPCARTLRRAVAAATVIALFACAPAAMAAVEHGDHISPAPPAPDDPRFMPGTVGPVVFRGTAATVAIPDGPGFGGEKGRTQNSGDLRKNNYSVTDANFNNVLGLLPRHPDTGAPLTYVQHIQLYAAAGFLEAYAPALYAHLVMHQDRGEGTVLGAAGHLMGLVDAYDPAAHGVGPATIPATLPGTTIDSRNYVRATRDATGQQWARPHHAQTAPAVFRMLVAAGLSASPALVLASDDGLSGAGRLNGVNEQNGTDGFNSGERATWALAAQLQAQTGVPVVFHMMHGHDHAGVDASALTRPKINPIIGFAADDRSTTEARAAAIYATLTDGRVATAATAAADQNLIVRNSAFLRPRSTLDVDIHASWDWHQDAGVQRTMQVTVENHGPHFLRDVTLALTTSANIELVAMSGPAVSCQPPQGTCRIGALSAEMDDSRTVDVTVRFRSAGVGRVEARAGTSSQVETTKLAEHREYGVHQGTVASVAMAALRTGTRPSACGATMRRMCAVRRAFGTNLVAGARPATYAGKDPRWVKVVFQQRVGRTWRGRGQQSVRLSPSGLARVRVKPDKLRYRGVWRVQVQAGERSLLRAANSPWRYLVVR